MACREGSESAPPTASYVFRDASPGLVNARRVPGLLIGMS